MHLRYGTRTTPVAEVEVGRPSRRSPSPSLSSSVQRHGDAVVIHLRGTLCAATASALHGATESALSGRPSRLVLDLDGALRGSEGGWWVLHAVADRARQRGAVPTAAVPDARLRARLAGMATCGLRIVETLPAIGEPSEPAELPPVACPPAVSRWGRDIEELLWRYGAALVHGDAVIASRCHTEPTFVTAARSIVSIPTREEVGRSLDRLAEGYREAGLVWARPALEIVRPLNEECCEATVLWCHGGNDKRFRVHARYRYLLRRVPHELATGSAVDIRINTVTLLDGPRRVAPLGRPAKGANRRLAGRGGAEPRVGASRCGG